MQKKELYSQVITYFRQAMPTPQTELHYSTNYELLVAVMLSAQCTDKRVNLVTPALFQAYPTPQHLAQATSEEVFNYIRSVSYPNAKSSHLVAMAQMLCRDFNAQVPSTLEELTRLPGVGRKTANVVQAVAFNKATMAVDTHVFRVSRRIGLVPRTCTTPLSVEKELTRHLPQEVMHDAHHWLILHGRYVCKARTPLCAQCGISQVCRYHQAAIRRAERGTSAPAEQEK